MYLRTGRINARRASLCSFLTLAVVVSLGLASTPASAQGGIESTGTGGSHKVQGRIFFPSGRRSDATAVKVTLESTSSERLSVIADLNGSFTFRSLAPGSYYLTVDAGEDYEPARESIVIEGTGIRTPSSADMARLNVARTFNVVINLRLKRSHGEWRTGVVNAALANLPKPAVEAYEKGMEAAQTGDSKKAVEYYRAAIALYPEFALALNELGVQYLKLHEADKAIEAFRSSLRIKPDESSTLLNYGIALLEKRSVAEAETQLRAALKKNDGMWAGHMYLGIALISLHNFDEAEKELQHALSIAGDQLTLPHYYLGGIYWHRGEHQRAADELEKYLRLSPKAPEAERIRATIKELRAKSSAKD